MFCNLMGGIAKIAGFVMQTNSIEIMPLALSTITGIIMYIEIKISRSYKELKRKSQEEEHCSKRRWKSVSKLMKFRNK